jgi:hypothetical protein
VCGVLGNNLTEPYIIDRYLIALYYRNFLENELPQHLKDVTLAT